MCSCVYYHFHKFRIHFNLNVLPRVFVCTRVVRTHSCVYASSMHVHSSHVPHGGTYLCFVYHLPPPRPQVLPHFIKKLHFLIVPVDRRCKMYTAPCMHATHASTHDTHDFLDKYNMFTVVSVKNCEVMNLTMCMCECPCVLM